MLAARSPCPVGKMSPHKRRRFTPTVLLLGADPLARLDAKVVGERLAKIQAELRDRLVGRKPRLVLAIGIGPTSRLSSSIYRLTDGDIESDDRDGQIAYPPPRAGPPDDPAPSGSS